MILMKTVGMIVDYWEVIGLVRLKKSEGPVTVLRIVTTVENYWKVLQIKESN